MPANLAEISDTELDEMIARKKGFKAPRVDSGLSDISDEELDERIAQLSLEEIKTPATIKPPKKKSLLRKAAEYHPATKVFSESVEAMRGKTPTGAFLRKYGGGATAGLIEPIAAGISAVAEEPLQAVGALPKRSLAESYKAYREKGREDVAALEEAAPIASVVGEIAGIASPGAAFMRIYKGLGKYGKTLKLLKGKGAGPLRRIVEESIKAGTANAVFSQLDPDAQRAFTKIAKDFGVGAPFGALGATVGYLGGKVSKGMREAAQAGVLGPIAKELPFVGKLIRAGTTPKRLKSEKAYAQELAKHKEGVKLGRARFAEQKEAAKAAKDLSKVESQESIKSLKAADDISVGESYDDAVKAYQRKLNEDLGKVSERVMKKAGLRKVSVEKAGKAINTQLKQQNLLDEQGNIIYDNLESIVHPERKRFYAQLIDLSERLSVNPNLKTLKDMNQAIQDFAEFGARDRTKWQKLYGKLSHEVNQNFYDAVQKEAGETLGKTFKTARKSYADQMDNLKRLQKSTQTGTFGDIVAGAKSRIKPQTIDETLKKAPQMRSTMAEVVFNDVINKANSPKALKSAISHYGPARLKKLFSTEQWKNLMEMQKSFDEAYKPLKGYKPPEALPPPTRPEVSPEFITTAEKYLSRINEEAVAETARKGGAILGAVKTRRERRGRRGAR